MTDDVPFAFPVDKTVRFKGLRRNGAGIAALIVDEDAYSLGARALGDDRNAAGAERINAPVDGPNLNLQLFRQFPGRQLPTGSQEP